MMQAPPKSRDPADDPLDPIVLKVASGLEFPLLVGNLEATKVADGKGGNEPAYEVTLKAVLPEKQTALLMRVVRDHKISVTVAYPDED